MRSRSRVFALTESIDNTDKFDNRASSIVVAKWVLTSLRQMNKRTDSAADVTGNVHALRRKSARAHCRPKLHAHDKGCKCLVFLVSTCFRHTQWRAPTACQIYFVTTFAAAAVAAAEVRRGRRRRCTTIELCCAEVDVYAGDSAKAQVLPHWGHCGPVFGPDFCQKVVIATF